jgi:hypothetical protein
MPVAAILAILQVVIQELPGAITTAVQLKDLATKFFTAANGTAPTAADIAALEAAIDADVATALTPLPPAQPGDPDYKV